MQDEKGVQNQGQSATSVRHGLLRDVSLGLLSFLIEFALFFFFLSNIQCRYLLQQALKQNDYNVTLKHIHDYFTEEEEIEEKKQESIASEEEKEANPSKKQSISPISKKSKLYMSLMNFVSN